MMQVISKEFFIKKNMTITSGKYLWKLVSLGFGIILITWLLLQLEWAETIDIIRNVPVSFLMLGFVCYGFSFYFRALRFKLLLPSDSPLEYLFPIVLIHYTALNIIPARLGELSYIYLLKKVNSISAGCSVSSLLIARVFDQIAISIIFFISSCFVVFPSSWLRMLYWGIGGVLILAIVLLIALLIYQKTSVQWLHRLLFKFGLYQYPIIQRVLREAEQVTRTLVCLRDPKTLLHILGYSFSIWLSIFSVNYLLLTAFGVQLSFAAIILVSTLIIFLGMFPLQLFGGVGIRETTWVFLVVSLGISKNIAIVSGFGAHIVTTLYLFVFGVYGLWRLRKALK
ncbi:MAG: lysylphosphatidylglycerol synthase transmembrane domain-containing protein [Candidatus Vecturithrix sp.]|jgi:uncharacterized protein (TIRG00374 family)|nr:lysylphosphatidylglycerol synthase transmembrane domain-containing protein [Candidatus Vecturithrix sp.]